MLRKTILRVFLAALVVAAIGGLLNSTAVAEGCLDQTGCKKCKACGYVCRLDAELVDVKAKCFEVESAVICIPRVVFPWQTGQCCFPFGKKKNCKTCDACDGVGCVSCNTCVNNGAKTRKVCILKSSSKMICPVCEYTWTAEPGCATGCCDTGCCDSDCCDSGCAAAPCDAAPVYLDAK